MTQTTNRRPSPRAQDFKARFGFEPDSYFESRLQAARQRQQVPPLPPTQGATAQATQKRYAMRAVVLALVIGATAGLSFLLGQGADRVTSIAGKFFQQAGGETSPQKPSPAKPKLSEAQPAAAPAKVKTEVAAAPVAAAPRAPSPPPDPAPVEVAAAQTPSPAVNTVVAPPEAAAPAPAPAPQQAPVAAAAVPPPAPVVVATPAAAPAAAPEAAVALVVPEPAPVTAESAPGLLPGQVFRDCTSCPDMVVVAPPGSSALFMPDGAAATPFAVGRTEVTFDDWGKCVADGGCSTSPSDEGWGRNTRPVINVSYADITSQYLPWLSRVSGKDYRLPTAQEWDMAAQPDAQGQAGVSCRSANLGNLAGGDGAGGACDDGFPQSAPAASLAANALGLYDMRGNVWEWLSDCWTPGFTYKAKASETDCRRHMLRGGSWSSRRSANAADMPRGWEAETRASSAIGFRLARSLP
jgi:hypothetical protein